MSGKFDEAARLKDEINGLRKVQMALLDEHIKHNNKLVGLKRANALSGLESVQFGADGDYYNDNETPRNLSPERSSGKNGRQQIASADRTIRLSSPDQKLSLNKQNRTRSSPSQNQSLKRRRFRND